MDFVRFTLIHEDLRICMVFKVRIIFDFKYENINLCLPKMPSRLHFHVILI